MELNIKKEILGWVPLLIMAVVAFYMVQAERKEKIVEEEQIQEEQAQLEWQNQKQEEGFRQTFNELQQITNTAGCYLRYSDWSTCTEAGQQIRLVNELEQGCNIGETSRSCTYVPTPLFSLDMNQSVQLVLNDLKQKNGLFQYTAYDQASQGAYVNMITLMIEPDSGRLLIARKMTEAKSGAVFSDTTMLDAYGSYEPDVFSALGQESVPYSDVDPSITAQHLTMWEQIISQYLLIYAAK